MNSFRATEDAIVIVGGGHAGVQLCVELAKAKRGACVTLVCEEAELPYQRPPLSKSFLKTHNEPLLPHRVDAWFATAGIRVLRSEAVASVDRANRAVRLASGTSLPYDKLVLATGARARAMPGLSPGLSNLAALRSARDARRLRALFRSASSVTLIGGGFIGLEVAATARALGKTVTVVESAPRLMQRAVSQIISDHVLRTHLEAGIDVRLGVSVGGVEIEGDRIIAFQVDGRREPVELLVVAIGSIAETRLAAEAGLECNDGVMVDECMRTSDATVLAIGDCTRFPDPRSGRRIRLESVQNANDQARTAAAALLGTPSPYTALPWFWSEQGSMRLQMAGLVPPESERCLRPGTSPASFSVLHCVHGRLACVESVNASQDYMAGRKWIEAGRSGRPDAFDLSLSMA